jgi:hypothetical protein
MKRLLAIALATVAAHCGSAFVNGQTTQGTFSAQGAGMLGRSGPAATRPYDPKLPVVQKSELGRYMKGEGHKLVAAELAARESSVKAKLDAARKGRIDRRLARTSGRNYEDDGENPVKYEFVFPSEKERKATADAFRKEIAAIQVEAVRGPVVPLPVLHAHRLEVGAVGRLRCLLFFGAKDEETRRMKVVYVDDEDTVVVEMGQVQGFKTQFALNIPTAGLVDGKTIDAGERCHEVIGTIMVAGSTVF